MALLTANYPPRGGDGSQAEALLAAWWHVLTAQSWLTDAIFHRAVAETLESVSGYLPTVADFLAFCRLARAALEDEAERDARRTRPALPAPPDSEPTEPDSWARKTPAERRAFAQRHIAIGKLRARHGYRLSENGYDPDSHPFGEEEIAAVIEEMQRSGWGAGPLAPAAGREATRLLGDGGAVPEPQAEAE